MIGKITLCDSCKKTSENPKVDGWIIVAINSVVKYALNIEKAANFDFRNGKALDFCSWRCFRKYWRGVK